MPSCGEWRGLSPLSLWGSPAEGLPRHRIAFGLIGPRAPETRTALLKYLRVARKRGFAVTVQTYTPWMSACAAPVRSIAAGEVTGTVVIAGPNVRLTEARMLELGTLLVEAARELSMAVSASPGLSGRRGSDRSSFFAGPGEA
ncbi:IclR family transcriptional regulator domain-containing protein [Xanthobacter autotrophicus]|uniref:IclR family transcriptional regulator domain-containing protein n=1 Tax=Xanthobacter autotrophicus TaxID=280 RepID=UPI003728FA64